MFKTNLSARFASSKSQGEVYEEIENALSSLGRAQITKSGEILISDERHSGFSFKTRLGGRVRSKGNNHSIDLDFTASPDVLAWIIAICFFPIGLLIFVLPYNSNSDFQAEANRILQDLRFDLEK